MESGDVDEQRRLKLQSVIEHMVLDWLLVIPVCSLIGAFAAMILFGALHNSMPEVEAVGWWTCVGVVWGAMVLLKIFETAIQRFGKDRRERNR